MRLDPENAASTYAMGAVALHRKDEEIRKRRSEQAADFLRPIEVRPYWR